VTDTLPSTLSKQTAAAARWDAIVVGAGIAGSLTAIGLARRGRKTLLIERASLPRGKVCGACLNLDAIAAFRDAGVWDRIETLGGHPLTRYALRFGGRHASLPLPGGHAVSRSAMDHALVQSVIEAGADYLDRTAVSVLPAEQQIPSRAVVDKNGDRFTASILVVASGLTNLAIQGDDETSVEVQPGARVGLGADWDNSSGGPSADPTELQRGTIYMGVGRDGYVGLVVTEDDRVNLAAAVDRTSVRRTSPADVCDRILRDCGWNLATQLQAASFSGTAAMTRRRRVAGGKRMFFVGDSSGYVEPFTGEGMAWAARSAMAAVGPIDRAVDSWDDQWPLLWTNQLQRLLGGRQRRCRWIARLLRYPTLARYTIGTLSAFPTLGQIAVRTIQQERPPELLDRGVGDRSADAGGHAA